MVRAAPGGPVISLTHPTCTPHSPSNLPEKLSVARHRFFFLPLFLASGMSMGWLVGISVPGGPEMRSSQPLWFPGPTRPLPTVPPSWPLTRTGWALQAEVSLPGVDLF